MMTIGHKSEERISDEDKYQKQLHLCIVSMKLSYIVIEIFDQVNRQSFHFLTGCCKESFLNEKKPSS